MWPEIGFVPHLVLVLALGLMVALTYANTLRDTGFVFDNRYIILEDPHLREATRANLSLIFQTDYWWPKSIGGLYRPLTKLSYLFNYAVLHEADHAAGYHWFNFFIHWLNAALVYFMALVLLKKVWPALFTAAPFATHPIATESVTSIIGRADLFSTAAILGGFLLYARSTTVDGWRKLPWLAVVMVVAALGEFSKENGVLLLGVMVLYDVTYRFEKRHPRWWSNLIANFWQFTIKGYVALIPPFLALWYVRLRVLGDAPVPQFPFVDNPLVSVAAEHGGFYYNSPFGNSFHNWLVLTLTATKVIGKYLWLLVWPQNLCCDYSYDQVPLVDLAFRRFADWEAVLALATVLAAITVASTKSAVETTMARLCLDLTMGCFMVLASLWPSG